MNETVANKIVTDETVVNETVTDETVVNETVADETVVNETVADETVVDKNPREKPRLARLYAEQVVPELMKKYGCKSPMAVPRLTKITLNMGVGEAVGDKKVLQSAMDDMQRISGQKPIQTTARKSIAGFKIREGYPIGCKVTLRRRRMYEFLDRLITIALPRSRDFRGLSPRSFDGRGNYNLGVREQLIFHEIRYENVDKLRGLDIAICTTAGNDARARDLLAGLGLPLRT